MHGKKSTAQERYKAMQLLAKGKKQWEVAKECHFDERTIRSWKRRYDGTLESLEPKSSRPKTRHPNAHTDDEIISIWIVYRQTPNRPFNEQFGILRQEHNYQRHYKTYVKFMHNNVCIEKGNYEKYLPKPYDTPTQVGVKCQQDVKCVPKECYLELYKKGERWFQFGIIDESSRETFAYPYTEQMAENSIDFDKRAFIHLGYMPKILQTDNGKENTSPNKKNLKPETRHKLGIYLESVGVKQQLIQAYTPRHNGKIERFNRTCCEAFYVNHTGTNQFTSFDDYKEKLLDWIERYNNNPHSSLRDKNGKQTWQTPREKRAELQDLYKEQEQNATHTIKIKLAEQTASGKTIINEKELTLPPVRYVA